MARNTEQMRFILNGFVPDRGFRLFSFEGLEIHEGVATRTAFTVRTDLSLIRGYGIRVQELPLLCRELLEHRVDSDVARHFIYTEEDMRLHQADRRAAQEAGISKKVGSKTPAEHAGRAWRSPAFLRTESHA